MTTPFPKILGLIPARMGSQGIPGKNMKLLGGKPLIQYTIGAARKSELLATVVVSTDSIEIARFASQFDGILVPGLRPAHLATHRSPMIDVVAHALEHAPGQSHAFQYVVLLQPTYPFRTPDLVDRTIRHIIREEADSLVTVRRIPDAFNPFWAYIRLNNHLEKALPDCAAITRRQDLPHAYYRDGAIYITRTSLIHEGQITGGKLSAWLHENEFEVNIDTQADWIKAENLLEKWKNQTNNIY
ncbi:acylneuraminate cytidylyltransferase family protein [Dyadobacter sp. 676]|uniref:Acylneuraminate cytidylyltransferase family protein n=1 Tax=Dyadobacter sp. 676 TaxID=3088362 RepID=A0AAU8FUI9_9BACT